MKSKITFLKLFICILIVQFAKSTCNDPNCDPSSCSTPNICTKCTSSGTVSYALVGGACQSCSPGYYSDGSGACSSTVCTTNCEKCFSATACYKCLSSYEYSSVSGSSSPATYCTACPTGQSTSGASGATCAKCTDFCRVCASATQCSTCLNNYGLQTNKTCMVCPEGQVSEGVTCKLPESNTIKTIVISTTIPVVSLSIDLITQQSQWQLSFTTKSNMVCQSRLEYKLSFQTKPKYSRFCRITKV